MSAYKRGYAVERYCAEKLRQMGFYVYRSAGSRGLADVIAINPKDGEVWLVQVKKEEAPKELDRLRERFSGLKNMDGQYALKSFIFIKIRNKYEFIKL
ncbi:MAG: restriction endonuclease [Candidatus Bathyarchaeia archaeon]